MSSSNLRDKSDDGCFSRLKNRLRKAFSNESKQDVDKTADVVVIGQVQINDRVRNIYDQLDDFGVSYHFLCEGCYICGKKNINDQKARDPTEQFFKCSICDECVCYRCYDGDGICNNCAFK